MSFQSTFYIAINKQNRCCCNSALVLTCFRLKKGRATFFRPETIVESFLHLMVIQKILLSGSLFLSYMCSTCLTSFPMYADPSPIYEPWILYSWWWPIFQTPLVNYNYKVVFFWVYLCFQFLVIHTVLSNSTLMKFCPTHYHLRNLFRWFPCTCLYIFFYILTNGFLSLWITYFSQSGVKNNKQTIYFTKIFSFNLIMWVSLKYI